MSRQLVTKGIAAAVIALGAIAAIGQVSTAQQQSPGRFYCGSDGGYPATMVEHPVRGIFPFIKWVRDFTPGSQWTPQRRCEVVSEKFQVNKTNGTLKYMVSGRASRNGLPVVCASQSPSSGMSCPDQQILMTLRDGDNPEEIIKELYSLNGDPSQPPLNHADVMIYDGGTFMGANVAAMEAKLARLHCQRTNFINDCP